MPYSTEPPTNEYEPSNDLPQVLGHKPVYALPYEHFDGHYTGNTDMRYISVGLAQYSGGEVSIKTMRHVGDRWTRQAEELPLHRVIDMALFLAKVLFDSHGDGIHMPADTFKDQKSSITILPEDRSYREMASYNAFLDRQIDFLRDRFCVLANLLNSLRESGKLEV